MHKWKWLKESTNTINQRVDNNFIVTKTEQTNSCLVENPLRYNEDGKLNLSNNNKKTNMIITRTRYIHALVILSRNIVILTKQEDETNK